jgi:hypothetical protein
MTNGARALHAQYLRLETHTLKNGCTNVPLGYIKRTLPVLFYRLIILFQPHIFHSVE